MIGEALSRERTEFLLESLGILAVDAQNGRADLGHVLERLIVIRIGDKRVIARDGRGGIVAGDFIDGAQARERRISLRPGLRQRLEGGFGLGGLAGGG